KSSLVGAGLLPRLETLEESRTWMLPQWHHDSRQWLGLRCTPGEAGDDPFTSMAYCLSPMLGQKRSEIAKKLAVSTSTVSRFFDQLAGRDPNRKAALLFIDQFEELFTTVRRDLRAPFVRCLVELTKAGSLHMVVTMRSDFYHHCIDNPSMAALLERGTYPLSVPRRDMLREMIELPAERAGLTFEEGLVAKILDDMGDEPGNLPLMAYLLDELHRRCADSGKLTAKAYLELDGVRGAIGKRAEAVFSGLQLSEPTRVFQGVFRQLVDVDGRGIATRQRARLDLLLSDAETRALADAFTNARLLTTARDGSSPIIEVAHEALLQSWERLSLWIQDRHDDLRLYGRLQAAAFEWEQNQRRDDYLWSQERLEQVYAMQRRLDVDFTPIVKDFTRPEIERLLAEFERDNTPDYRQSSIVDRIARMGDVGVAAMCVAFDVASRNPRLRGGWSSMDLYHTKNRVTLHMHEFLKVHASTAISALINHLKSANNNQRGAAVVALGSIEATVSDHQLSSMEVNLGYNVQKQSPFGDPSVVPALLPLLGDPDATVRQNTIYALGLIGDRSAVPPLRHALEDGDSRVRANAAVVLGFFRDHAAEDTLLAVATADRDGSARRAAAMALGKLVAPAAIAPLIRSLGETEEEWKRERVRILLRQYKDDRADAALRLCPSPWPPDQAVLPGPLTTLSAGADSPHVRRLRGLLKAVPWTCTVGLGSALGAVSAGGSTQVLPTSLLGRGIVLSALALLAGLSGALLLGRAGRRSVIRSPFARLLAKMFSATTYLMFAVLVSAYGMAGMLAAHIVVSPRGTRMAFLAAILFGAGSILGWRLGRSMAMRRLWVRFATSRTRKPQPQVDA
ncbi:MAG: HEAT repeat domain-containing protein, partial [Anaerolineae bacterium]|nr:HEAT repeat domain-containing protein [Anaerolineae bacterium]